MMHDSLWNSTKLIKIYLDIYFVSAFWSLGSWDVVCFLWVWVFLQFKKSF